MHCILVAQNPYIYVVQGAALIPHGQKERVTEGNKVQYLNALAYYRLAKRPNKQIQSFLKGTLTVYLQKLCRMF